jgi:hypothetical protein
MFSNRVRLLTLIVCLVFGVTSAQASPLSYAFSGTLAQPYNGSTQFSGTLTYDTDLPLYPGIQPSPGWSYYSGVPADPTEPVVSLTFNVGNLSSSTLGSLANDEVIVAHTQSNDAFYVNETFGYNNGQNLYAEIGMVNNNLVQQGHFNSLAPPSSLNLADFSMGSNLTLSGTLAGGQQVNVVGTVTSLEPIRPIPEPSSLLVFSMVLGTAVFLIRRESARHPTP